MRETYHEIAHALQHPPLPQFTNTDGAPLEPTILTYRISNRRPRPSIA